MNDISYYKKYEPIDGKWYLEKELGRGAYGIVFQAVRKDFGEQRSAFKMISIPSSQGEYDSFRQDHYDLDEKSITSYFYGFVEEFVKEFQLMATLKGHTNIVSYEDHDVRQKDGEFGWDIFIRMELLTPMNDYFKNKAPTERDIIKIGMDICEALEVCKRHNIIHRDIKPANIFISRDGNYKLGDFGVARTLEKTASGLSKKGTYIYMAPEVYKGQSYNLTVDLYSLGILMYRQLNDNFEPFRTSLSYSDGENAMERRMRGEKFPAPAHASPELAAIIMKACEYNPGERYASPEEMREALEVLYKKLEDASRTPSFVEASDIPFPPTSKISDVEPKNAATPLVNTPLEAPVRKASKAAPMKAAEAMESTTALRNPTAAAKKFCTSCGKEYIEGQMYCTGCRAVLNQDAKAEQKAKLVSAKSNDGMTVGVTPAPLSKPAPSSATPLQPPINTPSKTVGGIAKSFPLIGVILLIAALALCIPIYESVVSMFTETYIDYDVFLYVVNFITPSVTLAVASVLFFAKIPNKIRFILLAVVVTVGAAILIGIHLYYQSIYNTYVS